MATSGFVQHGAITAWNGSRTFLSEQVSPRASRRLSAAGATGALLDIVTVYLASLIALRLRAEVGGAASALPGSGVLLTGLFGSLGVYMGFFSLCVVLFSRSYRLYGPIQNRSGLNEFRMTVQAALMSGLLLCGAIYLARDLQASRIVVLLSVALSALLLSVRRTAWRRMAYRRYREGVNTRNVLIVGAGRVAHALRNHLGSLQHLGFRFKGFIALTEAETESGDADIVGDVRDCLSVARSMFVDEIFLSVPAERETVLALVEEAREHGIDVRVVPDLYDGLAWNAPVEYVGQFPTIPLHRRELPAGSVMLKRLLDLAGSVLALLILAPCMAAIALAIRLDSEGPIFYRAHRIGQKGRTFACFKFRTMVPNAEALKADLEHMNERDGILFKVTNDPRVTRVGRLLRKYSLDELPQFLNVLRGDMSLVGPRPPVAKEVEKYNLAHLRRLNVLPGITGLWQVEARQDPSFDSYISLDTAYVENWTVWLDLKILLRTVSVVLSGTGS